MKSMTISLSPIHITSADELAKKIAKMREEVIIASLNDFISRGLIETRVVSTGFVRLPDSANIEYRESVELILKDKEYIEKLEKENTELRTYKEQIKKLLGEDK